MIYNTKTRCDRDFAKGNKMSAHYTVIGAGLAGATAARLLADSGNNVLVLEKLPHVGGSVYDEKDGSGVLVHRYGPHIFHTSDKEVYSFLRRFTEFNGYTHRVAAMIDGRYVPVPFNKNSIVKAFGSEKGAKMISEAEKLETFPAVSVLTLIGSQSDLLKELGEYVYKNIFLYYTTKQWGKAPSEIDPATTARVPVRFTDDDRYFTDCFQGLPSDGYTEMVKRMLESERITVRLGVEAEVTIRDNRIFVSGRPVEGKLIYTGETDRLFGYRFGRLPYRTLDFEFETLNEDSYQPYATVNYTVSENFTRITEFKKMTLQKTDGVTSIMKEYSREFTGNEGEIPFYPVITDESREIYSEYLALSRNIPGLVLAGRLADYKYYNMDAVVRRVMDVLSADTKGE